jgi:hypothetical protein
VQERVRSLDFNSIDATSAATNLSPDLRRLIAIILMAAVFLGAAGPTYLQIWNGHKIPDDFTVVYNGARAMWNHLDIHDATNGMYIYSPFLAFVFQPLAAFSLRIAALIWLILSGFIILAASLIAARKVTDSWSVTDEEKSIPLLISASALFLSFEKIRSDFILGQTDCLILIGLVVILCVMERQPWLAGLATGVTANFKYLALIFIPYFIIRRNYRAALGATVSFVFFFFLPAAEVGLRSIKLYALNAVAVFVRVFGGGAAAHMTAPGRTPIVNALTWENSISLTSSIFRTTRAHEIPNIVAASAIAVLALAFAAALFLIRRRWDVDLFKPSQMSRDRAATIDWASLIVLALAFGPQTTARHMILMMLVYSVALGIFFARRRIAPRLALIISIIATAIALSLPFRETGVHPWLKSLKELGAASWCAVLLMFLIAWIGCRTISESNAARDQTRSVD